MPRANRLARSLVLDEMFDLELYKRLRAMTDGGLARMLDDLIPIEVKHVNFWQEFFDLRVDGLDFGRWVKLGLIAGLCRLFGTTAIHLVLEATEIYGLRKYLSIWDVYKDQPLGQAVREVLTDEFEHEDAIVSELVERKINPEKIRNVFLGFNDGLVEILGAVSGFFAAFGEAASVLVASLTVAVAGSLSMAAGVFASTSSEKEVVRMERGKARFLGGGRETAPDEDKPLSLAFVVGVSYFIGAMVPVIPVLFGARSLVLSVLMGGGMAVLVSLVLAYLSGMDVRKRIAMNLLIITLAVSVTYAIGLAAKSLWEISV
ncbi:MAG: VIT1/CCC1 transporter family protein [Nitrospirae bacterium]|nr:VIT1/CCC1 transporter family protein [Nitrospirota bacterium]